MVVDFNGWYASDTSMGTVSQFMCTQSREEFSPFRTGLFLLVEDFFGFGGVFIPDRAASSFGSQMTAPSGVARSQARDAWGRLHLKRCWIANIP